MDHYPHSLGNSDGAIYFLYSHKEEPLENLDVRVITWPALGEKFFFFLLLLMANNLLAYPLLKQEAGGTTQTKRL